MVPNPISLTISERKGKKGHLNQSLLLVNGIPLPFDFLSDLIDFRQLPCRLERESLNSLLFQYTILVPQFMTGWFQDLPWIPKSENIPVSCRDLVKGVVHSQLSVSSGSASSDSTNHRSKKVWRRRLPVDRNLPASTGNPGSIPGPGGFHMPWGS